MKQRAVNAYQIMWPVGLSSMEIQWQFTCLWIMEFQKRIDVEQMGVPVVLLSNQIKSHHLVWIPKQSIILCCQLLGVISEST